MLAERCVTIQITLRLAGPEVRPEEEVAILGADQNERGPFLLLEKER